MDRMSQLAAALDDAWTGADLPFSGAAIDSRSLRPGELFVALPGDRVDGHDYLADAAARGAAAALVSRRQDVDLPQLVVPDVLAALQAASRAHRKDWGGPLLAVTGSNGKTTVKELCRAVLERRGAVLATAGNLNNHIGVPLTLLGLRPEHRHAVVEMGASAAGEIALLAGLAVPDVGIVTQAGDAHLEGFGSRDGVARAKGELFSTLPERGVAVINAGDRYAPLWEDLAGQRQILRFGPEGRAEVHARDLSRSAEGTRFALVTPAGTAPVSLPLPGDHNVSNALAAAAGCLALGVPLADIAAGLSAAAGVGGRLRRLRGPSGACLFDDSYNANPESLAAGIAVLCRQPGRHWLVLGNMAELGGDAARLHAEAGQAARAAGVERCFAVGELAAEAAAAFGDDGRVYADQAALAADLRVALAADVCVLVKGSRSARMERVIELLGGEG